MDIAGQCWFATPQDSGRQEELALIDQPGLKRLRREVGTAHAEVGILGGFHFLDHRGSNVRSKRVFALDRCPATWSTRSCPLPAITP